MNALKPIPPTRKQLRQMQIEYHEASKPIIRALCDIENITLHGRLLIGPDGSMRKEENYSPEAREARERLLELLEDLKRQIFGAGEVKR